MLDNGLMLQYFESFLPDDGTLWEQAAKDAKRLAADGVTSVLLPPAYKCGDDDMSAYDLYDLGEFKQKGNVRTKYGTKDQYIKAIKAFHDNNINVYADVVLSRLSGADGIEEISAQEFNEKSSYQMVGAGKKIGAESIFEYSGRKGKYSDFKWNWRHLGEIDWDKKPEGDFDYILDSGLDLSNQEVFEELVSWAVWYIKTTDIDGFGLDGVSDVPAAFYRDFLYRLRELTGKELFSAGEYWHHDVGLISRYLDATKSETSLFDTPLHHNFYDASRAYGAYDLRRILNGTLAKENPLKAVTFVDNHYSQPGGAHESFVEEWFKPMAYSIILLRNEGYPCVFYGDYKGISADKIKAKKALLDKLMKLRKTKAYGAQHDYLDDPDCIGWTREGDDEHKDSGLAVVISDGKGGTKRMYIGRQFAGKHFADVMGNAKYNIRIDEEGCGEFYVNRGGVSVWVHKEPKAGDNK